MRLALPWQMRWQARAASATARAPSAIPALKKFGQSMPEQEGAELIVLREAEGIRTVKNLAEWR
jgi:hypothetical protein